MNSTGLAPFQIAQQDQFAAAAKSVASYAAIVRDALLSAGFTRDESVYMTSDWLQHTFGNALK